MRLAMSGLPKISPPKSSRGRGRLCSNSTPPHFGVGSGRRSPARVVAFCSNSAVDGANGGSGGTIQPYVQTVFPDNGVPLSSILLLRNFPSFSVFLHLIDVLSSSASNVVPGPRDQRAMWALLFRASAKPRQCLGDQLLRWNIESLRNQQQHCERWGAQSAFQK